MKFVKLINLIQAYIDLLLAREKPKAFPLELSLGTTSYCNLKCIMCPREDNEDNIMPCDGHLGIDYYKQMQAYLKRAKAVSLYGLGEPMIDKDYFNQVRYVNSFGADVSLSSNGTLMDEKRCREAIESGIKAIGISLDASTEETFSIVRPPGKFHEVIDNIKRLTRMKKEMGSATPVLNLSFGIMRQNLNDLPAFPDLAKELGCEELVIHPVIYQSKAAKDNLSVDREALLEAVEIARKKAEEHGASFSFWDLDPMIYLHALEYAKENESPGAIPETNKKKWETIPFLFLFMAQRHDPRRRRALSLLLYYQHPAW